MKIKTLKTILSFTVIFLIETHAYALRSDNDKVIANICSKSFGWLGPNFEKTDEKDLEQRACLIWNEGGIKEIRLNDNNFNIRNFSFLTRGLYRTYLKYKLSKGVPLSARERALLKVCLLSEIATLNSYSYVFYKELGFDDEKTQNGELESKYLLPQTTHDTKKNIDVELASDLISISSMREMQKRFINAKNKDDPFRDHLKDFVKIFRVEDGNGNKKEIKKDIGEIKKSGTI